MGIITNGNPACLEKISHKPRPNPYNDSWAYQPRTSFSPIQPTLRPYITVSESTGVLSTMSSIKCPNCGLVNFASAEECKRCKQALEGSAYPYWQGNNAVAPPQPDWSKLQTVPASDLADYGDRSHTVGNILFAIYLGLHVLVLPLSLVAISWMMSQEAWELLTTPTNRLYLPSFAPLYYVTLLGIVIYLPGSVILMVRLLQKSQTFLTWVVIYLLGEFVSSLILGVLMWGVSGEMSGKHIPQLEAGATQMQGGIGTCVISILITFIWFRYFTSSKRARAVFAW
jgi:uncharacterized protein DUF2569